MASPFQVFRKNRKGMLAALTILVMFGFVFIPMCLDKTGGAQKRLNPAVVKTTKYGDLTARDLQLLRQQRMRASQIMQELAEKVMQAGGNYRKAYFTGMGWSNTTDEALVRKWLIAHYAKDHDMVVDDAAIRQFLKDITDDRLDAKEIQAVFKRHDLSDFAAFAALRDELLVERAFQVFAPDVRGTTPAQRYDYYKRLKRQATVELVPIEVERFVEGIAEPKDNVLKAFYNEHKDTVQVPTKPDAGFREPARVELRYFKVDFDKFMTDNVTDDEILAYYEKNKELYDAADKTGGTPPPSLPIEEPAKSKEDATKKPETDTLPATDAKPSASSEGEPKPADAAPAADQPAAEKPTDGKSSAADRPSPFRLASFLQDAAAEPKAADVQPAADAQPPAEATKESTAESQPTEKKEGATDAKIDLLKDVLASAAKGPSAQIKMRVRIDLANEKFDTVFLRLQNRLKEYRRARTEAKRNNTQAPSEPDYQKMAADNGLTFAETKLLPPWELSEFDIGRAQFSRQSLLQAVYPAANASSAIGLDSLQKAADSLGNRYFFWKVRETKEETPKFDAPGMRDKVLHAWRMVKARELAKAEADKLAKEAKDSGKSLRETFANRPGITVLDPPPFSWLTYGSTTPFTSRTPPRLSEVEGVKSAGEAFMKAVFNLDRGQITTAMNQPKTFDYVVRLVGYDKSDEALWTLFQTDTFDSYAMIAMQEQREVLEDWFGAIEKSAGLKWERKPNQAMDESEKDSQ